MRFLHRKAFVLAGAFILLAWTAAARAQYLQPGQQPYVQPAPGQYVQPGASPYAQPAPGTYVQPAAPMVVGNEEVSIVESATQVLNEIMAAPAQAIPVALLHDAKGIIICPGMLKGGFVIGVKHGRGVLVVRDDNGNWRAPSFISITGGSIGWQIGIQATDVILVFKTKKSIQGLINGKFTIGGDVSAAAGPVGRDASASTDLQFRAEIYSYSRSRGLFAGAALDGSQVSMDNAATAAYYRGTGILQPDLAAGQAPQMPPSALQLLTTIATYSGAGPTAAGGGTTVTAPLAAAGPPAIATAQLPADLEAIRGRLADSSRRLAARVDPSWQSYLTLPPQIYNPGQPTAPQEISAAVERYNVVMKDSRYRPLTSRPEFQETFGLLKAYRDLQAAGGTAGGQISLPAPPK